MKVSVVMPAFNEAATIREAVRRVLRCGESVHELIVVDDGSSDATPALLEALRRSTLPSPTPTFRVIHRPRRGGKGLALREGLALATGDIFVFHDADLEYDPRDFSSLLAPLLAGRAEGVYGSRFVGSPRRVFYFWNDLANRIFGFLSNAVLNLNLTDIWTGAKAIRADVLRRLPLTADGFDVEIELTAKLAALGCRLVEVPVRYDGRTYAEGKKIRWYHFGLGLLRLLRTVLAGDLGEAAVGEQTLRVMSHAGRYNRYLREKMAPHISGRVLEVGAGMGNMSRFLLDSEQLTLLENDARYAAYLRSVYQEWEDVRVVSADASSEGPEVDALRNQYDTVVCLNVLEHIEGADQALRNMISFLRPGGRLVLLVPAHPRLLGSLDRALGHLRRYTVAGLRDRVIGGGLHPVEARTLNPLAVPGWWINGRLFQRRVIPGVQMVLFDFCTPLVRWLDRLRWPFGLSVFVVGEKPR